MKNFAKKLRYLIPLLLVFAAILVYPVRDKTFLASVPSLEGISNGVYAQALPDEVQNILDQIGNVNQMVAAKVTLSASPDTPTENGKFIVKAASFRFDETKAHFQWFVNGKPLPNESGFGREDITLTAGPAGTDYKIKVIVSATDDDGLKQTLNDEITVRVGGLDLSWWANTYTPLNYEGRPLMTTGSTVFVTALAQMGVSSKNLLYTWYLDDKKIGYSVGYDRQEFSFTSDDRVGASRRVKVEVTDLFGATISKAMSIKMVAPQVIIYKSDKIDVVPANAQAFEEYVLQAGQQINLIAVPYFFSIKSPAELTYEWSFNGRRLGGAPSNPNVVTLTIPDNAEKGTYALTVTARNKNKILQNAPASVKITVR